MAPDFENSSVAHTIRHPKKRRRRLRRREGSAGRRSDLKEAIVLFVVTALSTLAFLLLLFHSGMCVLIDWSIWLNAKSIKGHATPHSSASVRRYYCPRGEFMRIQMCPPPPQILCMDFLYLYLWGHMDAPTQKTYYTTILLHYADACIKWDQNELTMRIHWLRDPYAWMPTQLPCLTRKQLCQFIKRSANKLLCGKQLNLIRSQNAGTTRCK